MQRALAQSQGDWLVRLGLGYVSPDVDSRNLVLEGIELDGDGFQIDLDSRVRADIDPWVFATAIGLRF